MRRRLIATPAGTFQPAPAGAPKNLPREVEAGAGIEPARAGFAVPSITTLLPGRCLPMGGRSGEGRWTYRSWHPRGSTSANRGGAPEGAVRLSFHGRFLITAQASYRLLYCREDRFSMPDYAAARLNMVESQVRPNKVTDHRL